MATAKKKVILELGSFRDNLNARALINKVEKIGVHAEIACKEAGYYKVRTVPMEKADADKALKALEGIEVVASIL